MEALNFDIIVVGAGPAGCSFIYSLRNEGLNIALIEKSVFPRDKICGDALSADVINQFYRIDSELAARFEEFADKLPSQGVRFFAPNGSKLDIDFKNPNYGKAAGYISKRVDFDNFWFDQIKDLPNVTVYQEHHVADINVVNDRVTVDANNKTFNAEIVIGADGAHSIVNKKLGKIKVEKQHYCAGLRQYYSGVENFHEKNHIELHFYDGILPGYFWVFPLKNGQANIGLGMLSSEVSKQKVDLKKKLEEIVATHPNLKERFKNAQQLEKPQGFGLPIGSKKRPISGDRFLLLGDAASLIDPFTGEGIGNAIRSGRLAADHIKDCVIENRFDALYNKKYDGIIYHKMWRELRVSRGMQKLLKYPRLFNFVVKKANKNESVRMLLTSMLDDLDLKKELFKPSFYVKLLFN